MGRYERQERSEKHKGNLQQRPEPRAGPRGAGMEREICIAVLLCTGTICWYTSSSSSSKLQQQVAAPANLPAWSPVDSECGIWHSRDFLSEEEIEHMLALVNRTGGWEPSATGVRDP